MNDFANLRVENNLRVNCTSNLRIFVEAIRAFLPAVRKGEKCDVFLFLLFDVDVETCCMPV